MVLHVILILAYIPILLLRDGPRCDTYFVLYTHPFVYLMVSDVKIILSGLYTDSFVYLMVLGVIIISSCMPIPLFT